MKKKIKYGAVFLGALLLTVQTAVTAFAGETVQQYDPAVEGICSSYYPIDREAGYLLGIAPGTSPERLRHVCLPENLELSQDNLATGVTLTAGEDTLKLVVTGDLNGDGAVTITDMLMVKSAILGTELSEEAAVAADVNYDAGITITDFLRIKASLLGKGGISAGRPAKLPASDPLLLLTPGATESVWQADAVYSTDNPSIATVGEDGVVTAGQQEGSTFVYALDENGSPVQRTMVTVLQEKLTVTLDVTEAQMPTGSAMTLLASLNHPVETEMEWMSSDTSVVSVADDGALTAIKPGNAVISVSLPNGSSARADITVAPPITALSVERVLYKVKPGNTKTIQLFTEPSADGEVFLWESSNPEIATVSDGIVTGKAYGTVTVKVTGKYSGLTASCKVKVCDVKQVAVTFDDGPSNYTGKLLDFLKENDIRVTFFLVVNRIQYYENYTIREVQEGHEIGYHSYAHDIQTELSSDQIKSDFAKSSEILRELTGAEFTVWRTPGGGYSDRVLKCIELPHILWSLDTFDWESLNADSVYSQMIRRSADGDIILLHDLHRTSVEGAIRAMQEMNAGDYEFVTVTELLSRNGTKPENGVTYSCG